MKKLIIALLICLMPVPAFALGSWGTPTYYDLPDANVRIIKLTWTADAMAATVPNYSLTSTALAFVKGWNLYMAVTDPGATAPTDNYTLAILDQYAVDVMGGVLADCDTANTEQWVPAIGSVYGGRTMDGGAVTVTLADNAVNSATGTLVLFFGR